MIVSFLNLDVYLTDLINWLIPHNIFFNVLFSFFSAQGMAIIIWLLIGAVLIFLEEHKNKIFIIYLAVNLGLAYILSEVILKNLVMRPRPYLVQELVGASCPLDFSFPSSHAATAFAAAATLAFFDKKRRILYYILAVLISVSRIYLHCHYFFDTVFGALLGYFTSCLILRLKTYNIKTAVGKKT